MTASLDGKHNAYLMQDSFDAVLRTLDCAFSLPALSRRMTYTEHAILLSYTMANTSTDSWCKCATSRSFCIDANQGVARHLEQSQHAFAVIYPSDWQVQLLLKGLHHALPLLCA